MTANALANSAVELQSKWQRFAATRLPNIVMGLMIATLAIVVLFPYVMITVPSGHVGVLWKRVGGFGIYCWCFVPRGTVLEPGELREEGLHVIWPWDTLFLYDLRLQTMTRSYNAISKDGVSLAASISIRFQLQHDSVAQLHKFIGPAYPEMVLTPVIGSRAREAISGRTAEGVYSGVRGEMEKEITEASRKHLSDQLDDLIQPESNEQLPRPNEQFRPKKKEKAEKEGFLAVNRPIKVSATLHQAITILDTLVLGIELPPAIIASINRKVEQFYISQEYESRVTREILETKRKGIEAEGIRQFQLTVSQGISDSYLRWRGIEATLQLAQSNNAKIVVIGSGKDGLPIILGNVDTPLSQPATGVDARPDPANRANPPAVPLERSPAPGLPTPPDQTSGPAGSTENQQTLLPKSLSDLQSMILRFPKRLPLGSEAASPAP